MIAALARRSGPDDRVFVARSGTPVSARHYDTLFARSRQVLGWDPRTPVSAHVLRHTAITNVARVAGFAVAQTFAGHAPPTVTGRYIHASLGEVAAAVASLTIEPHPQSVPEARPVRRCSTTRRR